MKFKGYGVIWNPSKNKVLVNFKHNPEYETNDPYEIEVLSNCDHVTGKTGSVKDESFDFDLTTKGKSDANDMTKKEVMESLDASGIDYNPRDKKEILLALLEA